MSDAWKMAKFHAFSEGEAGRECSLGVGVGLVVLHRCLHCSRPLGDVEVIGRLFQDGATLQLRCRYPTELVRLGGGRSLFSAEQLAP